MLPKRIRVNRVTEKPIVLTGGKNEAVTNLELRAGELLDVLNYVELDGEYHGYASMIGYEVWDGTGLSSEVPLNNAIDPIDDTDRETFRAGVLQVPGTGPVRGVHLYKAKVYAVRDQTGGGAKLFVADPTGWVEVATPDPIVESGKGKWTNGHLAAYPDATGGTYPPPVPNTECFFYVDGVSKPISFDGIVTRSISDANLPCDDGATDKRYPTHCCIFDGRLWLAFPGGHLYYSQLGEAGSWDGAKGAGYFPLGDTITNLTAAPGNTLVVHMENQIKIIYVNEDTRYDPQYIYRVQEFSQRSGAIDGTAVRLLGRMYYFDDRGMTSLTATQAFGDYSASSMSKKVHRTYTSSIDEVTCAMPVRNSDQVRLFFSNKRGLCFTFNRQRKIKGATVFQLDTDVACVTEGDDNNFGIDMYFGSSDGFVYKMDSGTSFNGSPIITKMQTSYHNYGSPGVIKRFMKLLFEITSNKAVGFFVRSVYDYGSRHSPNNPDQTLVGLEEEGGVWGKAIWGQFRWGGQSVVQNPAIHIEGKGVNMSVVLRTNEKYTTQHVIHNVVVKYSKLGHKM